MSEEAFLLTSLHEVVKVWTRGSGQASFNLKVKNGEADLQLNFHLGHPNDEHLRHEVFEPVHPPPNHPHEENLPQQRRKKSANRRQRDRERAAQHQAHLRHLGSAAADSFHTIKAAQNVILPHSILERNLGLLKPSKMDPRSETIAASDSEAPQTPSKPRPPPPLTTPRKPTSPPTFWSRCYQDVSATKKQLFTTAAVPQPPPSVACTSASRAAPPRAHPATNMRYQTREDQLWTRLFNV